MFGRTYTQQGAGWIVLNFLSRQRLKGNYGELLAAVREKYPELSRKKLSNKAFYVLKVLEEDGFISDKRVTSAGKDAMIAMERGDLTVCRNS